ncbi:endonuclease/exonuclease/phosphatase family protein [Changchengzhania lutea]|uniref:endonuclease/exonuclease/phosphatase family protein n=1 Tax=Changchengzhania lutea TaxID=2049305 RepID=UPI00115E26B4|nr:endonuclease/exonuclease/phosphatase family protein [Changchengzhania lutea]
MNLKIFLTGFGIVAIGLTILPYIPLDHWWIRMFDFPHIQLTFLTALAIITYIIKFDFKNYKDYLFIATLIGCFIFQFIKIYPYTAFNKYEVENASADANTILKVFTANVLQDNEESEHLIKEMNALDADIMLFTEADERWLKDISKDLSPDYKYKYEIPIGNTYGMLLYSKLKLTDTEEHYMVDDSIPSIHTKVVLPNGKLLQLYAIHPTPPMPQENPLSTDRDAEMMMIAKLSRASKLPVIVLGDFNDVAWSVTSKLFKRTSTLLDVRIGRGMFSTFSADSRLLRWPLDHIFVSPEFRVKTLKSCSDISSDHFPFYTELSFEPEKANEQEPTPPTSEELKTAQDQIDNLREQA